MTVSQRRNSRSASAAAPTTTRPPTPISTGLSPASSLVAAGVGVSVAAGWSGVGEGVSPSVGVASGGGVGVALEGGADGGVALEDGVGADVDVSVRFGSRCRASTPPPAWLSHGQPSMPAAGAQTSNGRRRTDPR